MYFLPALMQGRGFFDRLMYAMIVGREKPDEAHTSAILMFILWFSMCHSPFMVLVVLMDGNI